MKKSNLIKNIIILFFFGILVFSAVNSNSISYTVKHPSSTSGNKNDYQLRSSQFELIRDFEASTYFISPEESPGQNDGVLFSFMANMEGNYTLQIENHPSFLTDTEVSEYHLSFDNPSGTNIWYIAYWELDTYNIGQFNFILMMSEDGGKSWGKRLIKSIYASVENPFDLFTYVSGTAFAADPKTGFMILTTWINQTHLSFLRSFDNGTTWSESIENIHNSTVMGTDGMFDLVFHPRIDVGIMSNGSILVVSESDDEKYTNVVFVESHNNGSSWSAPKNITCTQGLKAEVPKIQVDRSTGKYWLMWKDERSGIGDDRIQWAEFLPNQNLFDNIPYKNVSSLGLYANFDFYYDHVNSKFRFIYIEYDWPNIRIENWTCTDFLTNSWTNSILGIYDGLGPIHFPHEYVNYIYDRENILIFDADYLGNTDVYLYKVLQNEVFWKQEGLFTGNNFIQIYWNGKKSDFSPIETSLVKVLFKENHTTDERELYIIIDNQNPDLKVYEQGKHYFNPLSSNFTFTEIPWDLLPTEPCDSFLEIFSQDTSESSWNQILENNWEDSDPVVFYSYMGVLYVAYQSLEAGRKILYLVKSFDMGVSWSNPVKIFETSGTIQSFAGVAWGDAVMLYVQDAWDNRFIYRSFDLGNSFQEFDIYHPSIFPSTAGRVSQLVITNNGTMFLTFRKGSPLEYCILRSNDLGINWTISTIIQGNDTYNPSLNPNLGYDPSNDLIYFVMPMDNTSQDYSRIINISFSTFNFLDNQWSTLNSLGIVSGQLFTQDPKFIISRENLTATPIVRLVYLENIDFTDLTFHYKQIISDDLGLNWAGPYNITIPNYQDVSSNLDEIFYISLISDGNDGELFFKREGRLVRIEKTSLSSAQETELKFDGISDFGDLIEEGNYTYRIHLVDYAGNRITVDGWFFTDFQPPKITNFSDNRILPPTPRQDLIITVNVTDIINFSTYLLYKKDVGNWQTILMNDLGNDQFSATIPGDTTTNHIEYFIQAVDLAGNVENYDNGGSFSYGIPNFHWESEGLFKESKSYSSSIDYDLTVEITNDLQYVDEVIFRYSYDGGDEWDDLELEQNSPEFSGTLKDIPGDLKELQYKIIVIDIFGNEISLTDTREVEFYPDTPSLEFAARDIFIIVAISAAVGVLVAIGYIKLKSTSHESIYKQLFLKKHAQKIEKPKKSIGKKLVDKIGIGTGEREPQLESLEQAKIATSFTMVYVAVLCGTIFVFSVALLTAIVLPEVGMLLLAGSLLLAVFGYMILMSRDITINIYLEKIYLRNVALEIFQIFFMFVNIIMILFVGFTIDWFRYYLIESTFNVGTAAIPRLYVSIFAVFFTSLVLVGITTYIQLRKTVKNLQDQRSQGASANLLLYLKDQDSSRLITRLGYKTIVFLATTLLGIVTTTNLLTEETGNALIIVIIPFAIASFVVLIGHRYFEMKSKKEKKEEIELPFSDSKKYCGKCGKEMYLSDKFCGSCGAQQIHEEMFGTYISRCTECASYINDKAEYCTECGVKIQSSPKK